MTQSTKINPQAPSNKSNNEVIGMKRLETVLEAGAAALLDQIRYVLLVSQVNAAKSTITPYPEKPLTIRQARLQSLLMTMDDLTLQQVRELLKEVIQIGDASVRLPMLLRFAIKLPPENYHGVVRDVWKQVSAVVDPVSRARILFALAPLLLLIDDEPAIPLSPLLQVLAKAQTIKGMESRIRSLIALTSYLPSDLSLQIFQRILHELTQSRNDSLVSKALMTLAPHLSSAVTEDVMTVANGIKNPADRARALTALARQMDAESDSRLHEQALDAIDEIEDENDRADALIAFAPNLEYAQEDADYPILLEKALTSAIMFSRRPLRAKVLVALAPHLTLDLQREALAAVHSLESEPERANLLAQLAPSLPSDMLVASLAVAHTMREGDCRVQALTVLARYVPPSAQEQTIKDALAAASNLPNLYERVRSLVEMAATLPQHLSEQALKTALFTTKQIKNANARTRALVLLGNKLPQSDYDDAVKLAFILENPEHRMTALLSMVNQIPEKEKSRVYDTLLQCVEQLPLQYKQARALISLAPNFPYERLGEIETLAEKVLHDPIDMFNVYVAVAQYLPPDDRAPLILKAQQKMKRIDIGYDQASAITAIIPFLSDVERAKLPQKVLGIIQVIMDEYDKASAIGLLAPLLANEADNLPLSLLPDSLIVLRKGLDAALSVPQQQLRANLLAEGVSLWVDNGDADQTFLLWQQLARRLVTLPLADVLLCLGGMMPLFREIGGDKTIKQIAQLLGIR
ncbi:MAG: hypothetical protein Q9P01_13930 [Anaerolineae bacterium]|nr:hypothetical protein [Anaerolineae bacterium]MDQ7035882.1 hypothetical protein [Anaerolineae bacterium]